MNTLLKTEIQDWRIAEGVGVKEQGDDKVYKLKVDFDKITEQLFVEIDGGNGKGLTLFVEINEGRPCVHVGSELCGDNVFHAFGLDNGVVVTPETSSDPVPAEKSRYTYNTNQGLLFRS